MGTAAAVVVAATACITATDPANASASSTETPTWYSHQRLDWKRCANVQDVELRCATIKVPLDYRKPNGRTLDLAISRMPTSVPAKHRGILLFNPGGPGEPGLGMPVGMRDELPKNVTEQFDLIGFDPRGIGASSPVTCDLTGDELTLSTPYKPETFAKDVARTRTVARKCAEHSDVIAHITTRNTARDMDVIRAVLGEEKLSYLGYSYGTYLGAVYTQLFPKRADRIVLDSGVDPALAWRGMIQAWAIGSKLAFERFTKWAATRDVTYHLGRTPAAVAKTFWDLVKLADTKPIDGMTGDDIRWNFRAAAFSREEGAAFLVGLKEAVAGKPTDPALARTSLRTRNDRQRFAGSADDNNIAGVLSIFCNDVTNWPRDPEQYRRDAVGDKKRYPLAGDETSNIMPCAFWSVPHTEPTSTVDNSVGALVVQNEWDSQTPSFSGIGLHKALPGSRLVFVDEGENHGVYSRAGNKCAYAAVNAYLATGVLPARNVTCTADTATSNSSLRASDRFPTTRPNRF